MANTVVTSTFIANETMRVLHNESAFLGNINTQYDPMFAKQGAKAGSTVYARRPVQYTVRSGATASIQDVNETTVPITMSPEFGIDFAFTDYDLTLSLDEFSQRYIQPAGKRLASELDLRIGQALYVATANMSGTPGTPPATAAAILNAAVYLDNHAAPRSDRKVALTPLANAGLVSGMSGLFNDQATLARQLKQGVMATNLGVDFVLSQNLPAHTAGTQGGTPLVNGANQGTINSGATDNPFASTTSLVTDGWTAAAAQRLNAGDVITINGVFEVNPETKQSTGNLRRFVVTANASSDGSGNLTAVISPAIIAGGAYQNVSGRPADNAAITVVSGTSGQVSLQNIMYHPDAVTLVTADMDVPGGMDMAERVNFDGVSLRFVRGFDITNNRRISRFDILAGVGVLRPEWACRIPN